MRCELPTPRRCCFCVPLRIGLLIVGYIKIILSALYLLNNLMNLYFSFKHLGFSEHYFIVLILLISVLNSIVDIVFHLIFLFAAHKKDYRKIRWYYRYSVYNIIAITIVFFIYTGMYINIFVVFYFFLLREVIFFALIFLWVLVIQIYLLILVRSEFLKLKGTTQLQFVNNEVEAQCSATIKMSSEVDEVDDNNDEVVYDTI